MPLKILRQQYINELTAQEIGDLRDLLKRLKKIEPVQKRVLPRPRNKTYKNMSLIEVIKSFELLAAIVCMKHRISYDELTSRCRKRHLVDARTDFSHIAYHKICYNKSLISKFLGRRDHTAIINLLFKNPTKMHGEIKELFGAK